VVHPTPGPLYSWARDPVLTVREAGWASRPVCNNDNGNDNNKSLKLFVIISMTNTRNPVISSVGQEGLLTPICKVGVIAFWVVHWSWRISFGKVFANSVRNQFTRILFPVYTLLTFWLTSVLQGENKALLWSANYVASGFNTVEREVSLGYSHYLCRVEGLNLGWQWLDTGLTSVQACQL